MVKTYNITGRLFSKDGKKFSEKKVVGRYRKCKKYWKIMCCKGFKKLTLKIMNKNYIVILRSSGAMYNDELEKSFKNMHYEVFDLSYFKELSIYIQNQ